MYIAILLFFFFFYGLLYFWVVPHLILYGHTDDFQTSTDVPIEAVSLGMAQSLSWSVCWLSWPKS